MGFYVRKSISAGPFRFNLSKSGVGLSVGIRGLRIGTGPRGHYVHAGRGGFYYRATIGKRSARAPSPRSAVDERPTPIPSFVGADVEMVEIDSGSTAKMRDERFKDLLDEINAKTRKLRASVVLGGGFSAIAAFVAFAGFIPGAVSLFCVAVVAYFVGKYLDSYRRVAVIFYELDSNFSQRYQTLVSTFEAFAGSAKIWHIPSSGAVKDLTTWKRNAGAGHLLNRSAIALRLGLPKVVKCNIDVPTVAVGNQTLYFFPDFLMVYASGSVGAVQYADLEIRIDNSNFIEDGHVPSDAEILYYTWAHPNKSGGPDRRFKNNRQIPVCAYEAIHFSSPSGVNELVQLSRRGHSDEFAQAVIQMAVSGEATGPSAPQIGFGKRKGRSA